MFPLCVAMDVVRGENLRLAKDSYSDWPSHMEGMRVFQDLGINALLISGSGITSINLQGPAPSVLQTSLGRC